MFLFALIGWISINKRHAVRNENGGWQSESGDKNSASPQPEKLFRTPATHALNDASIRCWTIQLLNHSAFNIREPRISPATFYIKNPAIAGWFEVHRILNKSTSKRYNLWKLVRINPVSSDQPAQLLLLFTTEAPTHLYSVDWVVKKICRKDLHIETFCNMSGHPICQFLLKCSGFNG